MFRQIEAEDVMLRDYEIRSLSRNNAAKAYPLVQAACPEVSLDAWINYAARLTGSMPSASAAGIVVAECARGYIHGLFSYTVRFILNHQAVLTVENFIAVDFGDRDAATKALIADMDRLARDHGCSTIHTHIPNDGAILYPGKSGTQNCLRAAGHEIGSINFCKALDDN
ncbi:MAG: hypothetical protein OXT06_13810 [Rhodospirillaceae bacterium]|nr:hypothetical protein [Rhodospirillaceae bacterium]MDD9915379.1 hypothetical protein [Rhodospirillaceae bacterium]MDD9928583.1 hypothetical protein [Rhodospirillaceae bacterium]